METAWSACVIVNDEERRRRIKTVELIEEESPWTPAGAVYLVQIGYTETALRARVKEGGGRWNPQRKLWLVTRAPSVASR